jgi:hypothetical protein
MATTWEILKQHGLKMSGTNLLGWMITFAISTILGFIMQILYLAVFGVAAIGFGSEGPAMDAAGIGFFILLALIYLAFYLLLYLCNAFLISGSYSMVMEAVWKNRFQFSTYFHHGFAKLKPMIIQMLITCLFYIPLLFLPLLLLILMGVGFETGNEEFGVGMMFLLFLSWIPIAVLTLALLHAPIILIAEERSPWQSIKDSLHLFVHSFRTVFVTGLIGLAYIIVPMMAFLLFVPLFILAEGNDAMMMVLLLFMFLSFFVSMLVFPGLQVAFQVTVVRRYKRYLRKTIVTDEQAMGPWDDDSIYGFDGGAASVPVNPPLTSDTVPSTDASSSFPPFPKTDR